MQNPVSSELYDNDYYKKYNHGFDSFASKGEIMPELKLKFEKVDFANKTVLDVGCGRGEFVAYAIRNGAAKATGIDYSQASVDISKDFLLNTLNLAPEKFEVLQMDAKKLTFPDNSFDVVALLDVVEHLHDWELKQCITEVARVLKPSGELYIHTSPNKLMMSVVRAIAHAVGINLKSEIFHVNEQTYFSLKKYFGKAFHGKFLLEKDKRYWSNQMDFRGKTLKTVANIVDTIIDNRLIHALFSTKPFSIFFCTDLWFIGKKNA